MRGQPFPDVAEFIIGPAQGRTRWLHPGYAAYSAGRDAMARKATKQTGAERTKRSRLDPVITEIVRNGVMAVTEEMKTNLMRTAYNMIIYEALDFTVGLFTPEGETVSIGIGLPMFIRGMAETVKAKIRHFGRDGIEPGDIYVTNDAYITGSHLNHVTLTLPIFHKGVLVAFSCCMAHWIDIGGTLGGMTTDIFSEGLQIPILKYQDRGNVNHDLVEIIRQNVRIPNRALGDLRAQVTAVRTGERRFLELVARYGRDEVAHAIAAIMDRSEAVARAHTKSIPDGVYEAESFMDDDGIAIGKPIPIRVRVEVKGGEMTIDLTEVSRQVRGFYNSGITTGHACAQVAYKCLTSPTDYPINDGSFRSLKTVVPPGRVISATRPAPMRWWMTFPMTIVDTVFKALAPAIPDRVIAGHHADLLVAQFHGFNPKTTEFFMGNFGPLGGGWGAKRREDGVSGTVAINDGDTHNSPNEQIEAKFPLVIERYALVPDSGGAGRHRGGLGVERVVRARTDITLNTQIERAHCRPWGLAGGRDGKGNAVALRFGTHWKSDFPNAKVLVAQIKAGDAFRLRSGGGGGYGSPLDRPVEDVRNDVRQGYVSVHEAAVFYGVVIDSDTFKVNEGATAMLRART
jgi:N-methylhydantoinase B